MKLPCSRKRWPHPFHQAMRSSTIWKPLPAHRRLGNPWGVRAIWIGLQWWITSRYNIYGISHIHTYIHTYIHKSSSLTTLDVRWHQPEGHVSHVYWEFPKVFLGWWDISVVSWEGSFWREFPKSLGRNDTGLYQIVCFGRVGIEVPPLGCLKQRWWMVVFFYLKLAKIV